jgi:hypothetical protein
MQRSPFPGICGKRAFDFCPKMPENCSIFFGMGRLIFVAAAPDKPLCAMAGTLFKHSHFFTDSIFI